MARVSQTVEVDEATAATLLGRRADLVTERPWTEEDEAAWARRSRRLPSPDGHGAPATDEAGAETTASATFALERGPMRAYRRDVEARPLTDGRVEVTETTEFHLALGMWSAVMVAPIRHALRDTSDRTRSRSPKWAPPDHLDTRSATVLGLLLTLAMVTGYLGTVMTQTVAFAADEFGSTDSAQSAALAAVRVGTLGSLVVMSLSDHHGRRRLLLGSLVLACLCTAAGAFSPSLAALGVTQTVARCFTTAAVLLLTVVSAEEMPKGARAYAISVMTMTGALGAGVALWALPLADVGERGWRILYLIPLVAIPLVMWARRHLPESKRYVRPHREARVLKGHGGRLAAIGAGLFCASAFGAPSSQLLNDFLKDERGFSAARISLFVVLTSTPAGIGLVAGGRLADTAGRRRIVAIGIAGGAIVGTFGFAVQGWPMWMANLVATMLGAFAVPALSAYGPELFPTAARGKANGILQLISVTGSATGLLVAGLILDATGELAKGMLALLPLALMVAVLALTVFPETARRELEDINPEDDMTRPGEGAVVVPHVDPGPQDPWLTEPP